MPEPRSKRGLLTHVLLVTGLAAALLSFGVVSGFAADKAVETAGTLGSYHWQPSSAEVAPGGTVEFKNSQGAPHGVVFENPPAVPSCPGVSSVGSAGWSGTCTFAQAGTYKFYCPVHPVEMKGVVTVSGPAAPIVTAEAATAIKETEATLNGKVNPSGQATTYFFKYGTTTAYDLETAHQPAGAGSAAVSEFATVSGLTAATTYHFQLVAENASGTTASPDQTLTTAGPPAAATDPAAAVGSIEATLKGSVNPKGLATEYFFDFGPTAAYGQKTATKVTAAGTANLAISQVIEGLLPETTYHFQLVAKNSAGEVKGADRSFTTFGGPLATTGQASAVTETAATLEGSVNPRGPQTDYYFNYGTTTAYGQKTSEAAAGKGAADIGVSAHLTGLSAGVTYHFQLVSHNGTGTGTGADQTFTTPTASLPPTPRPPSQAAPPAAPAASAQPPETKIALRVPTTTRDRTPTIKFSVTGGRASYQCSVDGRAFKACRSPFTTPSLKPGKHTIRVRAIVGGLADPTPASSSFKVLAAR
jgi:plastocyanin